MRNRSGRRRQQVSRGSRGWPAAAPSRRLRLEGMEARLMLSTSPAIADEFMSSPLSPTQFSFDSFSPPASSEFVPAVAALNDGGFINLTNSLATPPREIDVSVPVPRESMPDRNPGDDSGSISRNQQPTGTIPADPVDDSTLSTFDGSGFDQSSLRPVVVPAWEPLIGPVRWEPGPGEVLLGPRFHGFSTRRMAATSAEEGGAIPIAMVLASLTSATEANASERVSAALSESDVDDAEPPNEVASKSESSPSEIEGELARAMVFEIVGGEPTTSREGGPERGETAPMHPVSPPHPAAEQRLSRAQRMREVSLEQRLNTARAAASEELVSATAVVQPIALDSHGISRLIAGSVWAATAAFSPGPLAMSLGAPVVDPARATAFEELTAEEFLDGSQVALDLTWRGAVGATPLLMLLALERIVMGNSRRAERPTMNPQRAKSSGKLGVTELDR